MGRRATGPKGPAKNRITLPRAREKGDTRPAFAPYFLGLYRRPGGTCHGCLLEGAYAPRGATHQMAWLVPGERLAIGLCDEHALRVMTLEVILAEAA